MTSHPERSEGSPARLSCFVAALLSMTGSVFAQSVILNNPGRKPTVAIRNATIYPVTSPPIANGTIVFANGTITAIGTTTLTYWRGAAL